MGREISKRNGDGNFNYYPDTVCRVTDDEIERDNDGNTVCE